MAVPDRRADAVKALVQDASASGGAGKLLKDRSKTVRPQKPPVTLEQTQVICLDQAGLHYGLDRSQLLRVAADLLLAMIGSGDLLPARVVDHQQAGQLFDEMQVMMKAWRQENLRRHALLRQQVLLEEAILEEEGP